MSVNVTGDGNNVAGRDLNQHHHYHQQTESDPLATAIEQRKLAFHNWQEFDQKRRSALRRRWLNIWSAGLWISFAALTTALLLIVVPALRDYGLVYWVNNHQYVLNNIISFTGATVIAPITTFIACVFLIGPHRRKATSEANYFASHVREMADECHRLDAQIKYLKSKK